MDNSVHMNPDYPQQRGCWIEKLEGGKARLHDYPTWRERNEPEAVQRGFNDALPECRQSTADFDTPEAAAEFAAAEHYVRCDMPAALRPKRPQAAEKPVRSPIFDL